MKEFLKRKFFDFRNDWVLWGASLLALLFIPFHVYQYFDSGFQIEPLIRVIFYSVSPIVLFFLGEKSIAILICFFMLVTEQFNDFTNYTSFFFLAVSSLLLEKKKGKIILFSLYLIDVFIVCERHDKTTIHLLIHCLGCIFIYSFVFMVYRFLHSRLSKKYGMRKLDLSEKERFILNELSRGNKQKEISEYSENTVSKILKKCREKNFCANNSELIFRFLSENPINTTQNPIN